MKLSSDEIKKLVSIYYTHWNSPSRTFRVFNTWAAENGIATRVSKKNVMDAVKRFENRVDVGKCHRNKHSLAQNEGILLDVVSSLFQQPNHSLRSTAIEMTVSSTTVWKIARRALGLYPYRLILGQALSTFDKIVRVEACHQLVELLADGKLVIFSDEATFRTDGYVNRWNCRIWDYERPDDFLAQTSQSAKSVTVFGALSRDHLFGPYIFPSTVTSDSYRGILSEMFIPDVISKLGGLANVWFQQDGAPAHTANLTKDFINSHFQNRVISRGFLHEWPPRSPDLTPCDFFLWGVVKDMVFCHGPFTSVSLMEDAIVAAFNVIRQQRMDHVLNAVLAVPNRMQQCIALGGSQVK